MRTAGIKCVLFVVVLTLLLSLVGGDADVSCVLMESCILPCSFRPDDGTVIHWIQDTAGNPYAHSYFENQDQPQNEHPRFKNRTSLFKDQISRGNASLQLTKVEVQDQGRYKCYTSTNSGHGESFINLKVNAAVSGPVGEEVHSHPETIEDCPCTATGTVVGVIVAFLVPLIIGGLVILFLCKKKRIRCIENLETSAQTGMGHIQAGHQPSTNQTSVQTEAAPMMDLNTEEQT